VLPSTYISESTLIIGVISLGTLLWAHRRDNRILIWVTKIIASTSFVVYALQQGALDHLYGNALFAALVFSWAGDLFLIPKQGRYFLAGLLSFLVAHLCFSAAFTALIFDPVSWVASLAAILLPGWALLRWILPALRPKLKTPVLAYIITIGLMLSLALSLSWIREEPIYAIAAFVFCLSDMAVARERFMVQSFWNRAVGLPLYYGSQFLFAHSAALPPVL